MTPPAVAEKTSREGLERFLLDREIDTDQTGWELGGSYRVVLWSTNYDLLIDRALENSPAEGRDLGRSLSDQAAALAIDAPQVESAAIPTPRLSGNLAEDVHKVCGLTWAQIAEVFKVSERAAAGWRMQGVPRHRESAMEALRTIGVTLAGGLGSAGVAHWLSDGTPSRLERLRAGEVDAVAAEARSYLDGPAD